MANHRALHSVGHSVARFLSNTYPAELREEQDCQFLTVSSGQLAADEDIAPAITLYLHRVTLDPHVRNLGSRRDPTGAPTPLALDLHFLLTVWADNPVAEHTLFAWALRQLHLHPLLDVSSLSPEAGWQPDEVIHLIPAELSNEDLMRIWDALVPSYRLSFCYVARAVRIDVPTDESVGEPVVARRLEFGAPESGQTGRPGPSGVTP